MNFSCLFFGIMFLIGGILFSVGKVHIRLAVWKSMPPQERAGIRIGPLCRNIGGAIALSGLIFLVSGLWVWFREHAFAWAMIAWLILAGLDTYYIGTSGRYLRS